MEYYEGINLGDFYLCDRCNVSKLNYYEYEKNIIKEKRYCDECFQFKQLQKWSCDKCKSSGTLRSYRKFTHYCLNPSSYKK